MGLAPRDGNRIVLGISVPVRQFASLFLSFGIILGRAHIGAGLSDVSKHFEFLKSLPHGTGILFLMNHKGILKRRPGLFTGVCKQPSGKESVEVTYVDNPREGKNCKWYFSSEECRHIMVAEIKDIDIESTRKTGTAVVNNAAFLIQILSDAQIADFTTASRLDCLLVTTKKRIMVELDESFRIADQLGIHYATVSRIVKKMSEANV
jgi:hypothetical protein